MAPQPTPASPSRSPTLTILTAFLAWKSLLLLIAVGAALVGDAYDTSGGLALLLDAGGRGLANQSGGDARLGSGLGAGSGLARLGRELVARLSSWDAVYFVAAAKRGYRFEQEWAFGAGLPVVVRALLGGVEHFSLVGPHTTAADQGGAVPQALAAIAVSNTAHLLSSLVLYSLGHVVWRDHTLSLVAALLHVLSPAGLFLSAPYAESSFALLSFTGYLLFALGCRADSRPFRRDSLTVLAGVLFGLATAFRSNGILNGIPFAYEAVRHLPRLTSRPLDTTRRLLALGVGGVCVAAGSLGPQLAAWLRFCSGASGTPPAARPWCRGYLPSIYAFVQSHYWNTGFLRYWTTPNIPLFLLAAPMLTVLIVSGAHHLTGRLPLPAAGDAKPAEAARLAALVRSAAATQVLLAVLAFTSYHVQIITRLSSAYPLWYWWVAALLARGDKMGGRAVVFMVVYACVQGALFTSFLPPA
ncbi:glycosyltransferase [Staphylotrichum tortipilum]|uniref:GPI mannosyltransferase 2 n=1 Tax=Staphylotrichum tortipilum TaxID=2831512 RepID=A0AAN6RSJ9_9PEZI|nr:glycosyltransferase [Staphylotrichum longicolle]